MLDLNAKNLAQTELAESISDAATSFTVKDASVLPDAPFRAFIFKQNTQGEIIAFEVVEVGSVVSNTLSDVERGLEETTAQAWSSGDKFANVMTAEMYTGLAAAVKAHLSEKASEEDLGHVRVDEETIIIDENGIISTKRKVFVQRQEPSADEIKDGDIWLKLSDYVLRFNGTNTSVNIGSALNLERTNPFTVEAWINTSVSDSSFGAIVCNQEEGNGTGIHFGLLGLDGKLMVRFMQSTGDRMQINCSIPVNTGEWVHVALTYDGNSTASGVKVYVNGLLDEDASAKTGAGYTSTLTNSILSTEDTYIGARAATETPFNGDMYEIRIWDYVRTQEQISSNKDKKMTGTEEGLIGHWPLDEGDGETAYDTTENNNGSILNGEWVVA